MYFIRYVIFFLNEHSYSSLSASLVCFYEMLLARLTISRRAIHELSSGLIRSRHLRTLISFPFLPSVQRAHLLPF